MDRVISVLKGKCPKCEKGDVFESKGNVFLFKMPKMRRRCPECSHFFESEPGFFTGAMYVSYALALPEIVALYFVVNLMVGNTIVIFSLMALGILLLSITNYRYSRIIWMYLFTKKEFVN